MHIEIPDRLQLTKLPPTAEMTLFLILEEMKSRRCMNRLEQAGFDTSFTSSDLGVLILTLIGFDNRPDELYEWYSETLDEACEKANQNDVMEWKQAGFDFYLELLNKKSEYGL